VAHNPRVTVMTCLDRRSSSTSPNFTPGHGTSGKTEPHRVSVAEVREVFLIPLLFRSDPGKVSAASTLRSPTSNCGVVRETVG